MKNVTKKQKRRIALYSVIIVAITTLLVANAFSYWSQIYKNVTEKKTLKAKLNNKLDEEEKLNKEITKLQDPEYVAKYAREKYLMSKNKEIIIRIDE